MHSPNRLLLPTLLSLAASAPSAFASGGPGGTKAPGPWVGANGRPATDRHLLLRVEEGMTLQEGEGAGGASVLTGLSEIDELNVRFGAIAIWRVHQEPTGGRRDPALFHALGLDRIYYVEFAQGRADLDRVAPAYAATRAIELCWPDQIVRHCNKPNDPLYPNQWNYTWEDLDCEPGWDIATGSNVLVSVIDSGADMTHPDLDANVWANSGEVAGNGKDDDGNGYVDDLHGWDFWNADGDPSDDNGHGSHVAGIIAAEGNNGRDIAGVCWTAKVQVVKVLDSTGAGTWTSMAQGMVYAADNGAVVSNYSFGGNGYDAGADSATQYAAGLDIVQVAAAGNQASSNLFYPAAYADVIAVMASDFGEKRARWSNFGSWCDLCAPGDGITSLWRAGGTSILTGTSQSAPHVSAIAALVRTLNPQLDRIDTELVIEYAAKDVGTPGRDSTFEWGIADLHRSLDMAGSLSLSATTTTTGGSVDLFVKRPDSALDFFVLVPSISERTPGIWLGTPFPGDQRYVPVNYDVVTDLSFLLPNLGIWVGFAGNLDLNGNATATFNVPGGKLFAHKTSYFSGIILPAGGLTSVKWVLNSVALDIQ